MRINEECIRDILKYLIKNITVKIKNNKGDFDSLSLLHIMNVFENQYSKEDLWYSVYNLSQDRFIETNDIRNQSRVGFAFVEIYNVTHRGHNFYESIKPDTIWNKTKTIVGNVGVHTLEFIESVAHDVIVESAKEATAAVVNKYVG